MPGVALAQFLAAQQQRRLAVYVTGAAAALLSEDLRSCAGHLIQFVRYAVDIDGKRDAAIHDHAEAHFGPVQIRPGGAQAGSWCGYIHRSDLHLQNRQDHVPMRQALKKELSANGKIKRVPSTIMRMIAPRRSKLIDFIRLRLVLALMQRHRRAFLSRHARACAGIARHFKRAHGRNGTSRRKRAIQWTATPAMAGKSRFALTVPERISRPSPSEGCGRGRRGRNGPFR